METRSLSLVIPSYKQDKTIVKDVKEIEKVLQKLNLDYELIVVVDGNIDRTYDLLKKLNNKKIKLLTYSENQGKGYAVRKGMLGTKGKIVGFIDAGGDIDLSVIPNALNYMTFKNADILIGSK